MTDEIKPKAKVKRINSKSKGSGFELTIAKLFSETFKPMIFRRSQSSGAILGGKNMWAMHQFSSEAKTLFIGDVVPSNESDVLRDHGWAFKRTVECKFYKEADSFTALFKNPIIGGWFEQATEDAGKLEKPALLIFKFNNTPVFFAIDSTDVRPQNISSSVEIRYNVKYNDKPCSRTVFIGLLNDALLDSEWWKKRES